MTEVGAKWQPYIQDDNAGDGTSLLSQHAYQSPEGSHYGPEHIPLYRNLTIVASHHFNGLIVMLVQVIMGFGVTVHTVCCYIFFEKYRRTIV